MFSNEFQQGDSADSLRRSESRLRAILDTIPDPAWLQDKDGRVLAVNAAWCRFFGIDAKDILGKKAFDLFPAKIAEAMAETDLAVVESRHSRRVDEQLKDKKGNLNWFETVKNPLFDEQGKVVGIVGLARNITERKQAEERSLAIKARLEAALTSMTDAVFISDAQGQFVDFNDAFAKFNRFGSKDECSNVCSAYHEILELYMANGEPAPLELWPVPRALRGEAATNVEYAMQRKDTGEKWFGSFSFGPIRDEGTTIVGAVIVARDITESKQAEEALQQMRAQLTHVVRLSTLGEMVAGLTHELNHPLYAILNYSKAACNVLAGTEPPDLNSLREWNGEIEQIALSAAEIVKRLRNFARFDDAPRTECRIHEILDEAVKLISIETQKHRVIVDVLPSADVPEILVDRVQIQQVLVNLLSNAVEAMRMLPVEMRRITIRTLLNTTDVEIAVADRGIGLQPGSETNIFSPFVTTKPGGLGMGLSIVRTIVEAHGGKVWASPNAESGLIFHFTIPLFDGSHQDDI
jgi:two-component system sensor kinase FixL